MQAFSVESKTSGISSLGTSWQDLEARYKSSNEVNMTPRRPRTKPEKMENYEDPARKLSNLAGQVASSIRRETDDKGPHAEGEDSRRLGKQHRAKEGVDWTVVGPGRSAQASRPSPLWGPVTPPFDLDASRAIYSPLTESHAGINSSSAVEEQRR
jgi:hypothetical protein